MIILVINVNRILPFELECYAPVSADPYRPGSPAPTFEFMQVETGQIHILRRQGSMQSRQNESQLGSVRRLNSTFTSAHKEAFKSLVFKALDHAEKCNPRRYTCQALVLPNSD